MKRRLIVTYEPDNQYYEYQLYDILPEESIDGYSVKYTSIHGKLTGSLDVDTTWMEKITNLVKV